MKIVICIFLVVATFAVYSQVQDHEFINFDDDAYVTKNLNVQAGLTSRSVKWAFTQFHQSMWFPMTWLSHMLDYQLYGLHPKGYLLTNLFFHIANALLLFMVLLRMTGALWQSGFVAVMFALHPLNVESVAWIAERKNVLSTLFWLLTMWAYIRYAQKTNLTRYSLVVLFFTVGLMSKAMLVTLPLVLLLLDYWPMGRLKSENKKEPIISEHIEKHTSLSRLIWEKVPLLVLAVGSIIMTLMAHRATLQSLNSYPLQERVINALVSYLLYLQKMIWPTGLAVLYPHPGNALAVWKGVLCGMALVGITAIAIRCIRKAPYLAVGWFWYLGTLVPVIGIVQVGYHAMADRFSYVPLIGIFIMIAWGLPELMAKWRYKEKALSISVAIIIPTLMVITWTQVSHWKNSITIFKHAIRVTDKKYPTFAPIHNNLGSTLFAERKTEEAISHYKMSIKLRPDHAEAHYNLGTALFSARKTEEAISHYKTAIKLKPDFAEAHDNLGIALFSTKKIEEAISHYKTAIRIKPDFALAHYNLGNTLLALRETEEAISHYKTVIKLEPNFAPAHNNLGDALSTEQKTAEALSYYKTVIKLKPDFAEAHYNLGNTLLALRETEEAIFHYKMAIKLKPDFAEAHYNLANTLLTLRESEEAVSHYKIAIKFKPDFAPAHNNLGEALFVKRKIEEAISYYKAAIKLKPDYVQAHHNLKTALLRLEEKE